MIAELVLIATNAFIGYNYIIEPYLKDRARDTAKSMMPPPQLESETFLLIKELFRSDEGWSQVKRSAARYDHWSHATGVYITVDTVANILTAGISGESIPYEPFELSSGERLGLFREFQSFQTRRKDRRKAELTQELARRVLARERGEALLGGPGPLVDDSSNDSQSASATLTFDPATKTIIANRSGDSLTMTDALRNRYMLPQR